MFEVNKNPQLDDLRKFGRAMLFGFGVIGLILWFGGWYQTQDASVWDWTGSAAQWFTLCSWGLGLLLWALSLSPPSLARPVYVVWMSVAAAIGMVMSTIMLSVLYFIFLPVFSAIVRFGDPLRRKRRAKGSYWEDYKPYDPTLERMKRLF